MSQDILHISDASFESEVLQSSDVVLVDFWAPWCGPCKAIAPVLDALASDYANRVKIVKMNVDENAETPKQYGVRGIPTLLLFKDGQMVGGKVGALAKPQLEAFLKQHV